MTDSDSGTCSERCSDSDSEGNHQLLSTLLMVFRCGPGVGATAAKPELTTVAFPATRTGISGLNIVPLQTPFQTTFLPLHSYTTVSSVHLFMKFSAAQVDAALGLLIAAKPGKYGLEYDILVFNTTHTATLSSLGGFPIYPQISCVDEDAGVLMLVVDDGKYPCYEKINLTTGEALVNACPSVNPDDALWWISNGPTARLVALVSWPLGPGYNPRVHKMVEVDPATGQQGKTLAHNLSYVESVLPTTARISNRDNTTDMVFVVADLEGKLRAAQLDDVLGDDVQFSLSDPLDMQDLDILFVVRSM